MGIIALVFRNTGQNSPPVPAQAPAAEAAAAAPPAASSWVFLRSTG